MKKFLKFLFIAILVLSAVAVTCFMFFKNLNKIRGVEVSVVNFMQQENRKNYNNGLNNVSEVVVLDDSTDLRLEYALTVINNLDDILESVGSYYLNNNQIISNENVANKLSKVNSDLNLAVNMINEFNIKANSTSSNYFNKHLGVNDLYRTTASYIVNYADLLMEFNNGLQGVDKSADIKFAMFDVYCRICVDTFSNLKNTEWINLENNENQSYINTYFKVLNGQLIVKNNLSADCNNFINAYNSCDKDTFAKNLKENCSKVSPVDENSTKEQWATCYFKKVYGI